MRGDGFFSPSENKTLALDLFCLHRRNDMNQAFSILIFASCIVLGFGDPSNEKKNYSQAMKEYIVKKSIRIKAEPQQVWDALTNPERTKNYFFHCKVYSDWKQGSDISFKGKLFLIKNIELKGKILKIEPNKLLQYDLKNGSAPDTEAGKSIVTDLLTYENGETLVSITDDVGNGEGAEKRYQRSEKGWDKVLRGLKKEVEEKR